jgi:hypothetical protein
MIAREEEYCSHYKYCDCVFTDKYWELKEQLKILKDVEKNFKFLLENHVKM